MRLTGTHIRFLSLFVVAFLCLNPGAVLCLAYCSHNEQTTAAHCPLKKQGADCPHSGKTKETTNAKPGAASFDTHSAKGCLMPVNIMAAPLESKAEFAVETAVVVNIDKVDLAPAILVRSRLIPKFYYRPPPNDHRGDRVRNQVFRI